mmetsp:Transcript_28655/g.62727  ORF Transcript_28655/g.62727 Transcript_28655/m.62727 type:complete len:213 (-) Transcript_28655:2927-3565(-)
MDLNGLLDDSPLNFRCDLGCRHQTDKSKHKTTSSPENVEEIAAQLTLSRAGAFFGRRHGQAQDSARVLANFTSVLHCVRGSLSEHFNLMDMDSGHIPNAVLVLPALSLHESILRKLHPHPGYATASSRCPRDGCLRRALSEPRLRGQQPHEGLGQRFSESIGGSPTGPSERGERRGQRNRQGHEVKCQQQGHFQWRPRLSHIKRRQNVNRRV